MSLYRTILNTIPRPLLIKISFWIRPFLAFWYQGKKYIDPIDNQGFRTFLPYGYQKVRANVLSPSTLSLERHRLLWLYLTRKTQFFEKRLKVLHVAPEQAFYKHFKKLKNLEYITTDLYSPLADIKADICKLPFEDKSFDVILCNHVLEHIVDDTKAMQELFRVLKVGGWGVFQVPQDVNRKKTYSDDTITDPKERTRIFGQYDHVRIYGMDYFEKLQNIGFEVKQIPCKEISTEHEIERFRLNSTEILPVCFRTN